MRQENVKKQQKVGKATQYGNFCYGKPKTKTK